MKIIFFCQRLHPNYTDSLRALARKHEVTVFVRSTDYPNERLMDLHVKVYPQSTISKFFSKLRSISGRTVSEYSHSYPSIRFLMRELAPSNCDVAYVRTPHPLRRAVSVVAKTHRRTLLYFDEGICPVNVLSKDNKIYPQLAAPSTNSTKDYPPPNFIPLTIDLKRDFAGEKIDFYQPEKSANLRLMHVGKLIERKGQTVIFDAVSTLVNKGVMVRLSMYSHTPSNAYRERLLNTVEEIGITEHVEFMPAKNTDEMLREYRNHDIFVYSGWVRSERDADIETFARATGRCGTRLYSLIEAMAAGLPVVCASERQVVGAVENGGNGLVFEKGNASDLVAKIEAIAGMDLRAMGARSRALIEEHHDAKDFPARFERFAEIRTKLG